MNLEQFATIDDAYDENKDIGLVTGLQFGADVEEKRIKCTIRISFEQDERPFLILVASNEYSIDHAAWSAFTRTEDKKMVFPKGFMAHLAMLTVGTSRGMLHVKTENTKFNRYFLPTINVAEMINDDVKFDF
ncbi:MAG: hypothetical protein HGB23_11205 [Chlorobiaceae bacterium]|nr:hypothetical protein [Chlorobiaceae bacterium]